MMFKVVFVSSGGLNGLTKPIIKNQGEGLEEIGINIYYFQVKTGILNYFSAICRLRRNVKQNKYDIIHAHFGLCGIISFLACTNTPLVVSFMGDDLLGSIKNYKYTIAGKIIVLINKIFAKYLYSEVIVKSQALFERLLPNTNAIIIPNGVNFNKFYEIDKKQAKAYLGWRTDYRYIIFCSNPNRQEKNFKLVSNSIKRVNKSDIKLELVYDNNNNDMKYYYSAADCLVLSSYHEGSPNVIKEAMACNCPIVSTKVGDVEMIIGNTKGCFLSEQDITDYSFNIEKALEYASIKNRTKGRLKIKELELDSVNISNNIFMIYNKLKRNFKD